jgi:hypothetical protein
MKNYLLNRLDNTELTDLLRGYRTVRRNRGFGYHECLFCGERFEEGLIYPDHDRQLSAERAAVEHLAERHDGPFAALLALGKEATGFSDTQREILELLYAGFGDEETARRSGGKAPSTIRNHRFHLRRRKREAMIQLSVLQLLEERDGEYTDAAMELYEFSGPLSVSDERTRLSRSEAEKISRSYLVLNGEGLPEELRRWPKKQKEKLVILDRIARLFDPEKSYPEREVNAILSALSEDYVTLRRYLVDYGLLRRQPGGGNYRRSNRQED